MSSSNCEIIYIPDKPPFSPTQQPTVNVFASPIDPKLTNTIVRKLNQLAPMENFRHVKRVRKRCTNGQTQLSVILCVAGEDDCDLSGMPKDLLELVNCYQLSPFLTQVCKYAATTKEEWEEQCKLWPTSFHPPTYNIDGITGFSEAESKTVFTFMSLALKLAKSSNGQLVNAAVIVDPSVGQIIASACDEISSWHIYPNGDSKEENSFNQNEASASHDVGDGSSTAKLDLNGSDSQPSCKGVSCLNPWQWSQEHLSSSSNCFWHPLRHAAMVAIENSAARDRLLFPTLENAVEKKSDPVGSTETSVMGSPAKKRKVKDTEENLVDGPLSKSDRPYLCTGYDIYLAWEPCPMCAMALVHQRIRRIFFAFPNPNTGALGSVHRLQGEKSLNHHYAVFRVVLHDAALAGVQECATTVL